MSGRLRMLRVAVAVFSVVSVFLVFPADVAADNCDGRGDCWSDVATGAAAAAFGASVFGIGGLVLGGLLGGLPGTAFRAGRDVGRGVSSSGPPSIPSEAAGSGGEAPQGTSAFSPGISPMPSPGQHIYVPQVPGIGTAKVEDVEVYEGPPSLEKIGPTQQVVVQTDRGTFSYFVTLYY